MQLWLHTIQPPSIWQPFCMTWTNRAPRLPCGPCCLISNGQRVQMLQGIGTCSLLKQLLRQAMDASCLLRPKALRCCKVSCCREVV